MPLYEVAVLSKPSKNAVDSGEGAALLLGPKAVVADDEKSAVVQACAGTTLPKQIEVVVRPFGGK